MLMLISTNEEHFDTIFALFHWFKIDFLDSFRVELHTASWRCDTMGTPLREPVFEARVGNANYDWLQRGQVT